MEDSNNVNDMFGNAYFGKPYKTRGGRKAIYQRDDGLHGLYHHWLITEQQHFACANSGEHNMKEGETKLDIVSEWHEEINEDELNELAERYACDSPIVRVYEGEIEAYKAGYRKATKL